MSELIDKITRAVEQTAGCPVTRTGAAPILETFRGETVWSGIVEVFDVHSTPPITAYGWAVWGEPEAQYIAVLGNPPIDSPLAAVRAWLVSEARK